MRILGFNRVELLLAPDDIHQAAERFNDLLGTSFAPLVWEVASIDEAREYILGRGHRIRFEYQEEGVKQIILDPDEWYGYLITSSNAPLPSDIS
jgi:hypothetical protein